MVEEQKQYPTPPPTSLGKHVGLFIPFKPGLPAHCLPGAGKKDLLKHWLKGWIFFLSHFLLRVIWAIEGQTIYNPIQNNVSIVFPA